MTRTSTSSSDSEIEEIHEQNYTMKTDPTVQHTQLTQQNNKTTLDEMMPGLLPKLRSTAATNKRRPRGRPKKTNKLLTNKPVDPPGARRSNRLKQRAVIRRIYPSNLFKSVNTFYLLSCLHLINCSQFKPQSPILWVQTDKTLTKGAISFEYLLKFGDPCDELARKNGTESVAAFCYELYEQTFIQPLNNFCQVANQREFQVTKGQLKSFNIGGWITVGIASFAAAIGLSNYFSISAMERKIDELAFQEKDLLGKINLVRWEIRNVNT